MPPKKLNLGCGRDTKPGWVNLDSVNLPGVNVVHDIEKLPLPFADGEFDEILCHDIIEHLNNYIPLLKELWRILQPGGIILVRAPHFTSKTNFIDPTHRRLFSVDTFDFFLKNSPLKLKRGYILDFAFSGIRSRRITFEAGSPLFFYNRFIAKIVNSSTRLQSFYESTLVSRLFPALNIEIILVK
jgi:SAM-dependent methyltransferase